MYKSKQDLDMNATRNTSKPRFAWLLVLACATADAAPHEMVRPNLTAADNLKAIFEKGKSPAQAPELYEKGVWKPLVPHWVMSRAPKPSGDKDQDVSSVTVSKNTKAMNRLAAELFSLAQNGTEWACKRFAADHFNEPKDQWYQLAVANGYQQLPKDMDVLEAMRSICGSSLRMGNFTFNLASGKELSELVSDLQVICDLEQSQIRESFRVQRIRDHDGYPEHLVFLSQVAQSETQYAAMARDELAQIAAGQSLQLTPHRMPLLNLYGISRQCDAVEITID